MRLIPWKAVAKRLVFHIGGYDPITSDVSAYNDALCAKLPRFQRTWSVKAAVDGLDDTADQCNGTTTGHDRLVETDYRLVLGTTRN